MTEQERSYSPSELEIGMIFDETELIIERDGYSMATIVKEGGLGDHRREFQIQKFMYDLIRIEDGKIIPEYNGGLEVYIDNEDKEVHLDYKDKLIKAGLWSDKI